jgi:hypothetical protein
MKATFTEKKKKMFTEPFKILFDRIGITLTIPAIILNAANWLFNGNINQLLVLAISLASLFWIITKIIGQKLDNKIKKEKCKEYANKSISK